MKKLIRRGKVAVLVSSDYGAGWYSWNLEVPDMLFDPDIAQMVLDEKSADEIEPVAISKWPEAYFGGVKGLYVEWVDEGRIFRIKEYDGHETIEFHDDMETWQVA